MSGFNVGRQLTGQRSVSGYYHFSLGVILGLTGGLLLTNSPVTYPLIHSSSLPLHTVIDAQHVFVVRRLRSLLVFCDQAPELPDTMTNAIASEWSLD